MTNMYALKKNELENIEKIYNKGLAFQTIYCKQVAFFFILTKKESHLISV